MTSVTSGLKDWGLDILKIGSVSNLTLPYFVSLSNLSTYQHESAQIIKVKH